MKGRAYSIAVIALAVFAVAFAVVLSYSPLGAKTDLKPACIAASGTLEPRQLAQPGRHWLCNTPDDRVTGRDVMLRFDLPDPSSEALPGYLRTRIGLFDSMTLASVEKGGSAQVLHRMMEDVRTVSGEPYFLVRLPPTSGNDDAIFVMFENVRHDATYMRAELFVEDPVRDPVHTFALLLIATLLGMMLVPLIFDFAFYQVLRSPFLLWHAALSLSFAVMVLLRSGLILQFVELSIPVWRSGLIVSLGVSVFIAARFTHAFIEEENLHPRLRSALLLGGNWALGSSLVHAAGFEFLAPLGGSFHSYALAPVLVLFAAVMIDAYRRGSRAVRFQLLGWIPLFAAFGLQLATYVLPLGLPTDALPMFYLGVLSETAITALGVADRFLTLRRERDEALNEAQMLETLTERDPLTGLRNRRALDGRFEALHKQGYDTFALIDLDHFKSVNDTQGHHVGDEVLKITASTLASDPEAMVIRMGGEEFFLLLRGATAFERAEKLRQSIPLRVAQQVPELDHLVTASMGLLHAPRSTVPAACFSDIYSRADMLLYSAKGQGRNRNVTETLRSLDPREERRRTEDRRQRGRAA